MNIKDETNKPTSEYPTSKEEAIKKKTLYISLLGFLVGMGM